MWIRSRKGCDPSRLCQIVAGESENAIEGVIEEVRRSETFGLLLCLAKSLAASRSS